MAPQSVSKWFAPNRMLAKIEPEVTTDRDEAIEIVSGKFAPHRLNPVRRNLKLSMRSTLFDDLTIHVMDYGDPIVVDATMLEDNYLLCIPTGRESEVAIGSKSWVSTPNLPALLPPDREFTLRWDDPTPQLVITIPKEHFHSVLRNMFSNEQLPDGLPIFNLHSPEGQSLVAEIRSLYAEVNESNSRTVAHVLSRSFADVFIARLLNAFYASVEVPEARSTARKHKVADAFLQLTRSSLEVSPVSAAEELGVPLRTLQEIVKDELDLTPTQVIQQARLERARDALLRADPTQTTVTRVAYECGFSHIGRFSVQYREAFNERPSETLRRG